MSSALISNTQFANRQLVNKGMDLRWSLQTLLDYLAFSYPEIYEETFIIDLINKIESWDDHFDSKEGI